MSDPADLTHGVLLRVAEFLRRLPADQLAELADGTAKLDVVPKTGRRPAARAAKPAPVTAEQVRADVVARIRRHHRARLDDRASRPGAAPRSPWGSPGCSAPPTATTPTWVPPCGCRTTGDPTTVASTPSSSWWAGCTAAGVRGNWRNTMFAGVSPTAVVRIDASTPRSNVCSSTSDHDVLICSDRRSRVTATSWACSCGSSPSWRTTRWHGIATAIGLAAHARATARRSCLSASSARARSSGPTS